MSILRYNIGNVLTQNNDSSAINTTSQRIGISARGIICVSPVIPEGTRIRLDSTPEGGGEIIRPFQPIVRPFENRVSLDIPTTIETTNVTVQENLPLEFVVFPVNEEIYIPPYIEQVRQFQFDLASSPSIEITNLNLKEVSIRAESDVATNITYRIENNFGGLVNNSKYITIVDGADDNPGGEIFFKLTKGLVLQAIQGSGTVSFYVSFLQ